MAKRSGWHPINHQRERKKRMITQLLEGAAAIAKAAKRVRVRWVYGRWYVLKPDADVREWGLSTSYLGSLESAKLLDVTFHCANIPGCGNEEIGFAEGTLSPRPVDPGLPSNLGFSPQRGFYDRRHGQEKLTNAKELDLQRGGHAHIKVLTER